MSVTENHEEAAAGAELRDEEAARAALRTLVEDLDHVCARLVNLHSRLPMPLEETAMLGDEVEMDFATEVRTVIECVLNDGLRPAIRDLTRAAAYRPAKKGSA